MNTTVAPVNSPLVDGPSIRSYCIGGMLLVLSLPGIIGNILVSYVEIKKGLLTSTHSSMYKLSFNLIIADTVHLLLLAFYLGISSMVQDWLLPDNWTREIPGRVLMLCWYNMLIDLCLLGLNRYLAVCKPQLYQTAFSKRNTNLMIAGSWIGGFLICLIAEQLMPCCSMYMYYKVYSYAFVDQIHTNYNDLIILLPANTLTSLIVSIAYGFVLYNVRVSNSRVADKITVDSQHRRRVKEIRYAFQLTGISAVFVAVWVLFNIFANVIPTSEATSGYFSVVIILEIINASANSFVCILFNKEIKRGLGEMFGCAIGVQAPTESKSAFSVKQNVNVTGATTSKKKNDPRGQSTTGTNRTVFRENEIASE